MPLESVINLANQLSAFFDRAFFPHFITLTILRLSPPRRRALPGDNPAGWGWSSLVHHAPLPPISVHCQIGEGLEKEKEINSVPVHLWIRSASTEQPPCQPRVVCSVRVNLRYPGFGIYGGWKGVGCLSRAPQFFAGNIPFDLFADAQANCSILFNSKTARLRRVLRILVARHD